jgi:molybdopterin-guanine dinucleotide biosynthesis protein A
VGFSGVVLAGGRGRRMGGVAKPALEVRGRRLLDVALEALGAADERVVVGGDEPLPADVPRVHEEPRGGGPVAALAAALQHVRSDVVVVLAADLPFVSGDHASQLLRSLGSAAAAMAVDQEGRRQPLLAAYDRRRLVEAMPREPAGAALRSLRLEPVVEVRLVGGPTPWFDCDTPTDLQAAREVASGAS